jgi:alpha-beta hydrolase superfamily lysophospholipase
MDMEGQQVVERGFFADENGWEQTVDDLYQLTKTIKDENPHLPVFLFGHSMGSFLSIRYIQKYGKEISGEILSGTLMIQKVY